MTFHKKVFFFPLSIYLTFLFSLFSISISLQKRLGPSHSQFYSVAHFDFLFGMKGNVMVLKILLQSKNWETKRRRRKPHMSKPYLSIYLSIFMHICRHGCLFLYLSLANIILNYNTEASYTRK